MNFELCSYEFGSFQKPDKLNDGISKMPSIAGVE